MKLKYIRTLDNIYYPSDGKQLFDTNLPQQIYYPFCEIKPIKHGAFEINFFVSPTDKTEIYDVNNYVHDWDNNTANQRIIVYPSGIKEIRYEL